MKSGEDTDAIYQHITEDLSLSREVSFFLFFFFNFFLNPIFPILRQEKCDDIAGINRSVGFVNLLRIAIYTGREERQSVEA